MTFNRISAINTALDIITEDTVENVTSTDLYDVLAAGEVLADMRADLMTGRFGRDAWQLWQQRGNAYAADEYAVSAEERAILADLEPWMTNRIRGRMPQ